MATRGTDLSADRGGTTVSSEVQGRPDDPAADLVLLCDHIFTSSPDRSTAFPGAVAIRDGRFVSVWPGDDGADALSTRLREAGVVGRETQVEDLGDAFLCPGFHDDHLHFLLAAINRSPYAVFCAGRCAEDCVESLHQVEDMLPSDRMLYGYGWRHTLWDVPRMPDRSLLDAAYPDRPVCLQSGDLHTLWLNGAGLAYLGIDEDSVPPAGGSYEKDAGGRLTGIVQEKAATALMDRMLGYPDHILADAVKRFVRDLNANGITSVCDMALTEVPSADLVRSPLYRALEETGDLTVRMHLYPTDDPRMERLVDLRGRLAESRLIDMAGLKLFFDGVSSTHTAWLTDPYANAVGADDHGGPTMDPELLRSSVMAANAAGIPVRVHTIGDAAIHRALDIFEEAQTAHPLPDGLRNGLEHLENLLPGDIDRLRELDVYANCQPPHIVLDVAAQERDLGPERCRLMWPFATYLHHGVGFSFGTDCPVSDIDSRDLLYCAVTRCDPATGLPLGGWQPQERIGMADALRAYTWGSAQASGHDDTGMIEAGKWADLVALDRDILQGAPEDVLQAQVLGTWLGGRRVYPAV